MSDLPGEIQINAWTDDSSNRSSLGPQAKSGLLRGGLAVAPSVMGPTPIDPRDWRDPRVGWGLVLPDDPDLSAGDKARAADAPAVLQDLVQDRGGVVLRYQTDRRPGLIRRYYDDGTAQDVLFASQNWGTDLGQVPRYLLIYGSPAVIPWSFQFELQSSCFAGRLDLEGAALERYVEALRGGWADSAANRQHTLVWAVDHNPEDITHLMRNSIAEPLHRRFSDDAEMISRFIDGSNQDASAASLATGLGEHKPVFIASTSHGRTGPLDDIDAMRADLGQLVDMNHQQVRGQAMTQDWQPDGAIWYAHACCSAGSTSTSEFRGLVTEGSDVDRILTGVSACGDVTAPFPRALLSAQRPLRAFVGHVEPTFDWSVRHPRTGQYLTTPLLTSFYQSLFSGEPIGMALDSCRRMSSGLLHTFFGSDVAELAQGQDRAGDVLAVRLMANDWRAFVLLGDPTCKVV